MADQRPVADKAPTRAERAERGLEAIQRWTLSEYVAVAKVQLLSLNWRKHAFPTMSYIFNDRGGQVVPSILHRNPSIEESYGFVDLQCIIVYFFAQVFEPD